MSSINTNVGAMVALQNLKSTNSQLAKVQDQVSTGLKVGSAADNAASWAVAETMRSDISSLKAVGDGLSMAKATVGVGREAAESVADVLGQIKDKLAQARNSNVDRGKITDEINQLSNQFDSIVGSAQFNGENVINGTGTMEVLASIDRDNAGAVTTSTIDVTRQDLSTAIDLSTVDLTDESTIDTSITAVEGFIDTAVDAAAALGSAESRIGIQEDFVGKLTDAMDAGVSSLVDADMTEASAELKALQTQQQLGVQAMSIANQAPQNLLQLFR